MNINWQNNGRTPNERANARLRARGWATPLRRRIDLPLLLLLALISSTIALAWLVGWFLADRAALLDPPVVRPLADERLRINLRDTLADRALLDATFHNADQRVYLLQEGGAIHTFDPATDLWTTEQPFLDNTLIETDLHLLRSGCGRDPASTRADTCADSDTIWAISRAGGLVRKVAGRWEVVIGDLAWIGLRGAPVAGDQVTAVANSADGRWLLLGTRADGVGLYDTTRGIWAAREALRTAGANPAGATMIVWWQNRFWIGGPAGLTTLAPDPTRPQFAPIAERSGAILDLDVEADRLWVLEQRPCAEEGADCLWMGTLRLDGATTTLLEERARYADLSLSNLIFAQQWGGFLVVAGRGGIFRYDPQTHTWERRFDQDVTVALGLPEGDGFFFAYPGGVGRLRGDAIDRWEIAGEQALRLTFGRDSSEVLALTDKGNLFAAGPTAQATVVFRTAGTSLDPARLRTAVSLGDQVLLIGPEGALLHNVVQRSYTDIPPRQLPDWMRQDDLRAYRAGGYVYFFTREGDGLSVYPTAAGDLEQPSTYTTTVRTVSPFLLDDEPRRVWGWTGIGLGMIGEDGSVFAVTPSGITRRTGPPLPNQGSPTINDVTAVGDTLVAATSGGLRYYDGTSRAWVAGPDPAETIVELDRFQSQILGRSDQGVLLAIDSASRSLIGATDGSRISDLDLSDARIHDGQLYLAGAGQVERYSLAERRITQRWDLPFSGPVQIKALVGGEPLVLGGEQAALGDQLIDPGAGPVVSLSADDTTIWTVRRDSANLYLKGYPGGGPLNGNGARCFFRNPWTPRAAGRIDDARELSSGTLALTTDAGLMFYLPQARSWYAAPATVGDNGGRLYALGDYLAVAEPITNTSQVTLIPLASIKLPDSCSTDLVSMSPQQIEVRAAAFDESQGRAAWITSEGALIEWQAGQTTEVLAAEGGPAGTDLRRVFDRPQERALLFSSDDRLWWYRLDNHSWSPITLSFDLPPTGPLAINVSGDTVTVRAGNRWYVGQLGGTNTTLPMATLVTTPTTTFAAPAAALVDIAGGDGAPWLFLLNDRLKFFDPNRRIWTGEATFPTSDPSRRLALAGDRMVAIGDNGATWWVAADPGDRPTTFAPYPRTPADLAEAIDGGGTIWRLRDDSQLLRCDRVETGYRCAPDHAPPMRIDTSTIRAAYPWEGLTLLLAGGGLRAFDPAGGGEAPISGTVQLAPATLARSLDRRLLLHDGATLVLLDRTRAGATAQSWGGVSALIFDDRGTPWARFGGEWRVWRDDDWATPAVRGGQSPAGLRLFLSEGQPALALDAAGQPYRWRGEFAPEGLPLPPGLRSAPLDLLLPGTGAEWWARSGARLQHLAPGSCPGSTPTPPAAIPTGTALPTGTPPAVTATPMPTATPQPVPCIVVRGSVDLPAAFQPPNLIAQARAEGAGLTLTRADGTLLTISSAAGGAYTATPGQAAPPTPAGLRADEWPTLRANQAALPDGTTAYDPITTLVADATGLYAQRPSTREQLADAGQTQIQLRAPLDVGWLSWDRAGAQLRIAGPSGPISLPKDQFIVDGQLIIEPIDAVLAQGPSNFQIANRFGIWTYRQTTASLEGGSITWQRTPLVPPMEAVRDRFLTAGGDITPGGALQSAVTQEQVTPGGTGDVVITEQVRAAQVSVTFTQSGSARSDLSDPGFIWDRNRRGIAYGPEGLLVQTDAGIHPATALRGFDAGPPGAGRLVSEGGAVLLAPGATWYRRDGARWQPLAADPVLNRTLFQNATWDWQLAGGTLQIRLAGQPFSFQYGPNGPGYGFSFDRISAASAAAGQILVFSEAFFEIADSPAMLADLTAPRQPPRPTSRLENLAEPDGTPALFHYDAAGVSRWDEAAQSFARLPASADPASVWSLVAEPRLRMTRLGGQIQKELRLDLPAGGDRWATFGLIDGAFPFDRVTSFAATDSHLYVGTAAGLEVYSGNLQLGLDQIDRLYDLSGTPGDLAPVTRVGRPLAAPDRVMARATICVELNGLQSSPCADPAQLDTRLRLQSNFWRWTTDAADTLNGVYLDRGGATTLPVQIGAGRFPHDRLRDVAACAGQASTLWEDGWVTFHPTATLNLQLGAVVQQGLHNDNLADAGPARFVCLERELRLPGSSTPAGLYLETGGGFLRYDGASWASVADSALNAALAERAERPPIVDRQQLRLMPVEGDAALIFEQQDGTGRWQPIPWDSERVALDRWREVVTIGDTLWAATPVGLVNLRRTSGASGAFLDPDSLLVVREPAAADGPCLITDLMLDGSDLLARCNADSAQVFRGQLDGSRDSGVFQPNQGVDPFSEQTFVNDDQGDFWRWRLTERRGGASGRVVAERIGQSVEEPIGLTGGRFDFDGLRALALFRPDEVEIAGDGGWFTTARGDFAAGAWRRPRATLIDPAEVRAVGVTVVGTANEPFLCLSLPGGAVGGGSVVVARDGSSEPGRCSEYLADDQLWRYSRPLPAGPVVITRPDGTGERRLVEGRFTDSIVAGLPLAIADGERHDYLIPTMAGVLRIDPELNKKAFLTTFVDTPPSALYLWDAQSPAYVSADGLYRLDDNSLITPIALDLPEGAVVESLEDGPRTLLLARWSSAGQRGWSLYDPASGQRAIRNRLLVDLSGLPRFQQNWLVWGQPNGVAELAVGRDQAELLWPNPAAPAALPYPLAAEVFAALSSGERVLLFGRHEIYELHLAPAIRQATQRGASP